MQPMSGDTSRMMVPSGRVKKLNKISTKSLLVWATTTSFFSLSTKSLKVNEVSSMEVAIISKQNIIFQSRVFYLPIASEEYSCDFKALGGDSDEYK